MSLTKLFTADRTGRQLDRGTVKQVLPYLHSLPSIAYLNVFSPPSFPILLNLFDRIKRRQSRSQCLNYAMLRIMSYYWLLFLLSYFFQKKTTLIEEANKKRVTFSSNERTRFEKQVNQREYILNSVRNTYSRKRRRS